LKLPGAVEGAHMGHPDFRVGGKVFATLGYPSADWGMVKLTPEQQRAFVESAPKVFVPVKGGWGFKGATNVLLKAASAGTLGAAPPPAGRTTAPKALAQKPGPAETTGPARRRTRVR